MFFKNRCYKKLYEAELNKVIILSSIISSLKKIFGAQQSLEKVSDYVVKEQEKRIKELEKIVNNLQKNKGNNVVELHVVETKNES